MTGLGFAVLSSIMTWFSLCGTVYFSKDLRMWEGAGCSLLKWRINTCLMGLNSPRKDTKCLVWRVGANTPRRLALCTKLSLLLWCMSGIGYLLPITSSSDCFWSWQKKKKKKTKPPYPSIWREEKSSCGESNLWARKIEVVRFCVHWPARWPWW